MPQPIRKRISGVHQLPDDSAETIAAYMIDQHALSTIYANWTPLERSIFEQLVESFSFKPFGWKQLREVKWDQLFPESYLRLCLLHFCSQGVLFAFHQAWGEQVYLIPIDAYIRWRKMIENDCKIVLREASALEHIAACDEPASVRMLRLLSCIALNPLRKTIKGTYYQKDLRMLAERAGISEKNVPEWIEWACRMNLLAEQDKSFIINKEQVCAWLRMDNQTGDAELFMHWLLQKRDDSAEKHHCYARLMNAAPDEWFLAEAPAAKQHMLLEAVKELNEIGWLEFSIEGERLWINRPSSKHGDAAFYVMDDFEVIALPHLPYRLLWELELIAERKRDRSGGIYLLTADSLQRACKFGRNADQILQFLNDHALYGVPSHVAEALHDWAEREGSHRQSRLVSYPDPAMIERCSKTELKCDHAALSYKPPNRLPEAKELYPELDRLPRMWWTSLRRYHASTRKEMIIRAIEWKVWLKLKNDEKEIYFIPDHMIEDNTGWRVAGRLNAGSTHINIEDWKEMQLILPGINDKTNSSSPLLREDSSDWQAATK